MNWLAFPAYNNGRFANKLKITRRLVTGNLQLIIVKNITDIKTKLTIKTNYYITNLLFH